MENGAGPGDRILPDEIDDLIQINHVDTFEIVRAHLFPAGRTFKAIRNELFSPAVQLDLCPAGESEPGNHIFLQRNCQVHAEAIAGNDDMADIDVAGTPPYSFFRGCENNFFRAPASIS